MVLKKVGRIELILKPSHSTSYKTACASTEVSDQPAQADQNLRCPPLDALAHC